MSDILIKGMKMPVDWEHVKDSNSEYAQALYQLGQVTIEAIQESPTVIEAEVSEE